MKLVLPGKIQSGYFYAKFQGSCFDHNENISFFFQQLPTWINMLKKRKKKEKDSFPAQSPQKMQPHGFQVKKEEVLLDNSEFWKVSSIKNGTEKTQANIAVLQILWIC